MSYNPETQMFEGYIYFIKNMINGKGYVGQTKATISHRMGQHISPNSKKTKCAIDYAISKYGKQNFSVETIGIYARESESDLLDVLNMREKYYIEYYNTCFPNGGYGYNIDEGGASCSYKTKPIDVYDLDGIFIETCKSGVFASEKYEVDPGSVYDNCNGIITRIFSCEYYFRYHGDEFWKYHPYQTNRQYDVYQFSMDDGHLIRHFYSLHDAASSIDPNNVNIIANGICNALLNNNRYSAYGYFWSKTDYLDFDIAKYRNAIAVDKYDCEGNLIKEYKKVSDALEELGAVAAQQQGIKKQYSGETPYPALGYIWRIHGEPFDKYPVINHNPSDKKKVDQYSMDGEFIRTFDSIADARVSIGLDRRAGNSITKVCNKEYQYFYGYVWRWNGDQYTSPRPPKHFRAMNCYSLDYKFIKTYINSGEAARDVAPDSNNYHSVGNNIRTAAQKGKTSRGYRWYYADDPNQPDKSHIIKNDTTTKFYEEVA